MGGKKKAAPKKGKGPADAEEDLSVDNFMKVYRKKCAELEVPVCDILKQKYDVYLEDNNDKITKFHVWKELGEAGTRAIFESLRQIA